MIDFPASPTTGQLFTASGTTWRFDGEKWNLAFTAASSIVVCSDMPPISPSAGTLWWDSVGAQLYVWYVDPNSAEWVPTSNSGGIGDAPTDGQMYGRQASAWAPVASTLLATNVGRNLIHNPLFNIAQRGIGPFTGNAYTLDRWVCNYNLDSVSFSQQAMLLASDEQARNCLRNVFTGNAGATAYSILYQPIEDVSRLSNKTVTVSFWAATTSGTPRLGVSLDQSFGTGGSPSSQVSGTGQATPPLSSTWTRYTMTFALPSIAGMTLGSNGNHYTALNFWFSSGTTQAARAGNIGVQSGTVLLWGIQLEIGAQATALEKPDPQQDLAKCQRFYAIVLADSNQSPAAAITVSTQVSLPVTMRAVPTITFGSISSNNAGAPSSAPTASEVKVYWSPSSAAPTYMTAYVNASADL